MKIPFFNYSDLFKSDEEQYIKIFKDVASRGAYILQSDLVDFEKKLADFIKVKHVIGVANGTDALIISLLAVGIKAGDEVILPSHTYVATAASVNYLGAKPILAECGIDHMLAHDKIEQLITDKTKAIMPVHINGRSCNMEKIMALAKKYDLKIIEDAAQGLGAKFQGKCAGTFGSAGTFSFYPAKTLGCFGDGGAIATNDDNIAKQILLLRDHGRDVNGEVVTWGLNSRLDNLQAAFLNYKLSKYQAAIECRRSIAKHYTARLSEIKQLTLPPAPDAEPDYFDIYQNYEIEADSRDNLIKHLANNGIKALIQWGGTPVHQFKKLGFTSELPITDALFKRCLMLPMNTTLSANDIDYIADKIEEFYS